MAYTRKTNIQFGGSSTSSEYVQFGSTVGSGPLNSLDPAVLQANAAWLQGWQNAIFSGDKAPVLEEMNGLCYVFSYQLGYIFQQGVPEWDANTTYVVGSIVQKAGMSPVQLYESLVNPNLNNALPSGADNANWRFMNPQLSGNTAGYLPIFSGLRNFANSVVQQALSGPFTGNIGIGMVPDAALLGVAGIIESTAGGFKFPDGTIQATAATNVNVGNALKYNLQVFSDASTPNSKVDVTADLMSVQGILLNAINLVGNIQSSGANGLDTGSVAPSTWYALHLICSATGAPKALLFSLSATAPTLPAGYANFRRIGWVRTDASGNILRFSRQGDDIFYRNPSANNIPTLGTNTSLSPWVPATSQLALLSLLGDYGAAAIASANIRFPGETNYYNGIAGYDEVQGQCWAQLSSSQTVDISIAATVGQGYVIAYRDVV